MKVTTLKIQKPVLCPPVMCEEMLPNEFQRKCFRLEQRKNRNFITLFPTLLSPAKYPQLKKLMRPDPMFKVYVAMMVLLQFLVCYAIKDQSWTVVLILAYTFGGVINHSLTLAVHEIAHNLAFGHSQPMMNRLFGFFANLPIGIPMSISFKKYHLDHHRYQGDDEKDVDIPSRFETLFFNSTLLKFVWVLMNPWFYSLRPFFINPKPMNTLEIANMAIQFPFDYLLYHFLGFKALAYLIIGSFMGTSLHPMAGHFISEHYMFVKGYETYSYYGPLNWLTWNVGYHTEHHDFPSIPGSNLPKVKALFLYNVKVKLIYLNMLNLCLPSLGMKRNLWQSVI